MSLTRLHYYRRIFRAYVSGANSQLTFWHDRPEENPDARFDKLGPYYMTFAAKADYPGPFDMAGVPQLNYHGAIGIQYNPIAIAQYGLGNFNLLARTGDARRRARALAIAQWLAANLERNPHGLDVWNHHFDWDYRTTLRAPWYSALAQGQGISLLARVFLDTGKAEYRDAARRAFACFTRTVDEGGVCYVDADNNPWLEEYLVDPPTHILNGFIWALWGVYDYALLTQDAAASDLFARCVRTLKQNLSTYDTGYWSLYEHSGTRMKMLASPFYHRLHIVQLRVMARMTGEKAFAERADRWEQYARHAVKRNRALVYKAVFKLVYY